MSPPPPEPRTFRSEHLEVEMLPSKGARLHRIRAFGRDLLRTPDDPALVDRHPFIWGGHVMAPWCNRIGAGPVELLGRTANPEANDDDGTAIHGLVHLADWTALADGRLRIERPADTAWPWRFAVEVEVEVADDGSVAAELALRLAVVNLDDGSMPAGVGIHPWWLHPVEVEVPARSVHVSHVDSAAEAVPVSGDHDLRVLGRPASGLDATWTDLDRPRVVLRWAADESGPEVTAELALGPTATHVVVANIEGLDVAVEPQTHGPDGVRRFRAGEAGALAELAPGDRLDLELRYRFRSG